MRPRATLEAEIWVLRQQINVLRRAAPRRQSFGVFDRLIFVGLYRLFPKGCDALAIVKPDTIIRWHRAGFRAYWRWKSRPRGGRPTVPFEIRRLIREMSIANPLWGAPRIHGELVKLGIDIGQTSVAKYMARRRGSRPAPHQDVAEGADRGTGRGRNPAHEWRQGKHARHAARRCRKSTAGQHLHEPVPEALAFDWLRRHVPGSRRLLFRRLRYPQPRSRGGGISVDEGGDDQARVDDQRGENFVEKRPTGTLRLPRLLVRRAFV